MANSYKVKIVVTFRDKDERRFGLGISDYILSTGEFTLVQDGDWIVVVSGNSVSIELLDMLAQNLQSMGGYYMCQIILEI